MVFAVSSITATAPVALVMYQSSVVAVTTIALVSLAGLEPIMCPRLARVQAEDPGRAASPPLSAPVRPGRKTSYWRIVTGCAVTPRTRTPI